MKLSDDVILRYVAGAASDEEIYRIDAAMAADERVLRHVQSLFALRDNFDDLWESFLNALPAPEDVLARAAMPVSPTVRAFDLASAVGSALKAHPDRAEQMGNWLRQALAAEVNSFRLLIDRARNVTALAAATLQEGFSASVRLQFGGIGLPDRELEDNLRKASEELSKGDADSAGANLEAAAGIDPRQSRRFELASRSATGVSIDLVSNSTHGQLVVRWSCSDPSIRPPSLCLLCSETDPSWTAHQEPGFVDEESLYLFEFLKVPDGTVRVYLVD